MKKRGKGNWISSSQFNALIYAQTGLHIDGRNQETMAPCRAQILPPVSLAQLEPRLQSMQLKKQDETFGAVSFDTGISTYPV